MEDVQRFTVIWEDDSFLIVDKKPGIPTVPLKNDPPEKVTLLSLVGALHPEVLQVCGGRNIWEGGVLHRLDTATSGLVVMARTKEAYTGLQAIQKSDLFWKEYLASSGLHIGTEHSGFPPYPYEDPVAGGGKEIAIGSLFRPYGQRRREVRPVLSDGPKQLVDKTSGRWYLTNVCYGGENADGSKRFICRLSSGFRHQVRAHLAWSGWPLDGDELYGGKPAGKLALCATAVRFLHPITQQRVEVHRSE